MLQDLEPGWSKKPVWRAGTASAARGGKCTVASQALLLPVTFYTPSLDKETYYDGFPLNRLALAPKNLYFTVKNKSNQNQPTDGWTDGQQVIRD